MAEIEIKSLVHDRVAGSFFKLVRPDDPVGISGTGDVAFGLCLPDGGQCFLIWRNSGSDTISNYISLDKMMGIHCHHGTTIEFIHPDKLTDKQYAESFLNFVEGLVRVCNISMELLCGIKGFEPLVKFAYEKISITESQKG